MSDSVRHTGPAKTSAALSLLLLFSAVVPVPGCTGRHDDDGLWRIRDAFENRKSGFMVTARGTVDRVLADDDEGSRHQRFILDTGSDLTLLISHNIDLADRVPVRVGDSIEVRGQYEWNPRGGVLHWTHRDPDGRRPGGWIRAGDHEYR